MAARFYLLPKIGSGIFTDPFRPKYVFESGLNRPGSAYMPYGAEDTFLVGLEGITPEEHTTLAANADVLAVPVNLDNNLTAGAVTTAQTTLEGWKIPAGWVSTAFTYRQVIGNVGRFFILMQRFNGREKRKFFETGITLDTRVNQLSQAQRQAIQNAAISLGLSTGFITGNMTLRNVLKGWVDQMGPFTLGGETF